MKNILYNRNSLTILSYLGKNRFDEFLYGSKIASDLGINQGGTSLILREFEHIGILKGKSVGKTLVYTVNQDHPLLRSFRVFENMVELNSLIESIKPYCKKIILFGSCAKGEDNKDSDFDLFILTGEIEKIRTLISSYETERAIKPVMITPMELVEMQEQEKVFYQEIEKGMILWEV
jgi:predicted nucleotidyltransferase